MAKRAFYEKFKEISNQFTGPMTASSFQKTGKLTPQEFVEAGDALVQKCPAWEWASGEKDVLPFLPPEKKFLILRNAPSNERASAMMADLGGERDEGDDWVSTHADHVVKKPEEKKAEEEEETMDWGEDGDADDQKVGGDDTSKVRSYDLTVVYDQYYASPRVFLFGYGAGNQPLNKEQMMEDVYSENREKTVTVDPHPFLKTPCISIHPCRHAETMQRIMQRMADRVADEQEEAGVAEKDRINFVFPPYLALFIFLKFIASVVPTISYDISMDLDM